MSTKTTKQTTIKLNKFTYNVVILKKILNIL